MGEGTTLNNLGTLYHAQGQYAQALNFFQQALVIVREVGNRMGEGTTLNNLGVLSHNRGQHPQALDFYQQALVVQREVGDRAGEGTTLNNLGDLYLTQRQYAQALNFFQQALSIHREVGDRTSEGIILNNLGGIYAEQGQYAQALDFYQQALDIHREVGDRAGEGTTLNNLGGVYLNQGQYAQALDFYQQALGIHREVRNRTMESTTLNNLGEVYRAQGQYTEAMAFYQQAMDVLEDVRASAGSEQARASFIAQHASLYTRATALAHQQGQDDLAFQISERGRARTFLDSLTTGAVQLSDQDAQDLLVAEQGTYAARQNAQDALAKARAADPPDANLITALEQQLATAEQAHTDALQAIEAHSGQIAALVPSRTKGVLTVKDVQALLDPQTTLISFFVADEQTLTFILTRDRFSTVALPVKRSDLVANVQALRAFANTSEAIPASARQLYDALIAPLKPQLTTRHLAIVPHSVLHYLPFAALSDGQRFLIDDYALTVLPSASSLAYIQQNVLGRTPVAPLIMGNPASTEPGITALPFAEHEAHTVADMYKTEPLLGTAATEDVLRQQVAQAGIVHLAAHGKFNPVAPLASAVYLTADTPNTTEGATDPGHDGRLEVGEIYGLDLHKADMVVLSACQTQLGDLSAGDELVGLTRALFFAGTPSVIATLWSVNDQATGLLMERFYTHLRAGMGKAAALRQAQQDVRAQYPNPYYWAGFVLSGDAGAVGVPLGDELLALWPWFAVGGLVVTGIAIGGAAQMRQRARRMRQPNGEHGDDGAANVPVQPIVAPEEADDMLAALLAQAVPPAPDSHNEHPS